MWKAGYLTLFGVLAILISFYTGFLPAFGFFLLASFIVIEKPIFQKTTIYSAITALSLYFILVSRVIFF